MNKSLFATGIVLTTGIVAGLVFYGRPIYRQYKEKHNLAQSKSYLAKGDFRNASLCARRTLLANPRNVEACRVMAELADKSRSPQVLDWLLKIVQLEPSTENKLLLACEGLKVERAPYPLTSQLLQELAGPGTHSAAYQVIAAELAIKLNRVTEAERHLQRVCELEPANELHQLNLAVLRAKSTNSQAAAEALATLERIRHNANLAPAALRCLITQRQGKGDFEGAENLSRELLQDPRATLEDGLQLATILRQQQKPGFEAHLGLLQQSSATNAGRIYALSSWMVRHDLADRALQWLSNCPANLQAQQPVPLAFVDCLVAKKDWIGLENLLERGAWGDSEFLRLAFLSRASAEQKQELGAEARWRSAVREAGDRLGAVLVLLGLARSWGGEAAREELLWQFVRKFPDQRWAGLELNHLYQTAGNTLGLNKLAGAMAGLDPNDFETQNNLAATSLLLKLDLARAHEIARENYSKHAEQAIIAATYGFSLFIQGRTNEALAVFDKLKPAELENPAIALYYASLLANSSRAGQAGKYLELARAKSACFLPEERALLTQSSPAR